MPPIKRPPRKVTPEKLPPGKLLPQENCPPENCHPRKIANWNTVTCEPDSKYLIRMYTFS